MTNSAALFAHSIQFLSSTVIVMTSSMNPSIDAYMDVVSTARGSDFESWFSKCCLFYFGSKDLCGEFRSSVSQYLSRSRSFPRYIFASLAVVYSTSRGVVPKGNRRQRKAIFSTIAVQFNAVVEFAWIWR